MITKNINTVIVSRPYQKEIDQMVDLLLNETRYHLNDEDNFDYLEDDFYRIKKYLKSINHREKIPERAVAEIKDILNAALNEVSLADPRHLQNRLRLLINRLNNLLMHKYNTQIKKYII